MVALIVVHSCRPRLESTVGQFPGFALAHEPAGALESRAVFGMTRQRTLFLHRAIAGKLRRSSNEVVSRARRNLRHMMARHPGAHVLLEE